MLVAKFLDHPPLQRQEAIFERAGMASFGAYTTHCGAAGATTSAANGTPALRRGTEGR